VMRCWHGYLSGVRCKWFWCHCHPIISCFITTPIPLVFLVPAYRRSPGKETI